MHIYIYIYILLLLLLLIIIEITTMLPLMKKVYPQFASRHVRPRGPNPWNILAHTV